MTSSGLKILINPAICFSQLLPYFFNNFNTKQIFLVDGCDDFVKRDGVFFTGYSGWKE